MPKTVIVITGPTASGKTELAIDLALHFNTSIISADSRQCFRELNIGVAKPSPEQLKQVRHYFINSHSIHDDINASVFESLAVQWSEEIFSGNEIAVMCGGTGLYIQAFRDGLDEIPVIQDGVREQIQSEYHEKGINWLQEAIRISDPLFYCSGEISNPQRMMRALEVVRSTGRSIISFRNLQKKGRGFNIIEFALRIPRKDLYDRINRRVERMIETGLLEEVRSMLPYQHLNALQTVGYSELFEHLKGMSSLDESVDRIKQHTRHYAKRQETWLNKLRDLIWLENNYLENILKAVTKAKI